MQVKGIAAIVGVIVAAVALSGCFIVREASWTIDNVKPGKQTALKIGLMSEPGGDPVYVLVGLPHEKSKRIKLGNALWDSTKRLGKRPKKMVRDDAAGEAFMMAEHCPGVPFIPLENGPFWRTKAPQKGTTKFVEVKLPVKVGKKAPGGGLFGTAIVGVWEDDGDGVPEDPNVTDDEYTCSGIVPTGFRVRGKQGEIERIASGLRQAFGN